ncbi:MAG: amidohydrolase [Clostridia bacterium]|nr:amidohydrolase [Clostridia bacterium]
MIIDFHTHTFPERIAASAVAKLQSASHTVAFSDGTDGGLLASMQRAGVDASVVLPVATNPLKLSSMNDSILANEPDERLIRFGAMHPDAPDWQTEMNRLAANGVKGIKLHPVYQGMDIDDARSLRVLECAGKLGLIVVMHAGDDIGFPGVVRCSPAMTGNALRQVGPVRLVMAHMGGWRNWDEVAALAEYPNAYIDTAFSLDAFTPLDDGHYAPGEEKLLTQEKALALIRAFGTKRVLFATDSPWGDQAAEILKIKSLPLTAAEQQAILGKNARTLLKLSSSSLRTV